MMKSRRVRRVIGLGSLAFALTTSIPNRLPAQPAEPPAPATTTGIKGRQATATPSAISKVTAEVEQERRFNELRRELLESRVKLVDWWLTGMAIFLTFFGIVTVLVGYLGYRRFREIEVEARQNVAESKQHADEAAKLVAEIKTRRDEAESVLMNAESAAERPDKTSEAAQEVKENPAASPIDRARADAVLLQQQGKLEEALRKWCSIADVVEGTDQDVEAQAWFSIGYLSVKRIDYKAAICAYDKVLQIDPKHAAAYTNRGSAKYTMGQHEPAIIDHDKAIQLDPELTAAYVNRGNAKHAMGQHEAAIIDYDKAIQLDPELTAAYVNRGNAKHAMGQHEAAIIDYDKAIQLDPDLTAAYDNRGNAKYAMGQHEAAIIDHDKAVQLDPQYAAAYYNRGNARRDMGQHEAAIIDYDRAIQLAPSLIVAYDDRGIANSQLGRINEARQDFQKGLVLAREVGDKDMETRMEALLADLDKVQ